MPDASSHASRSAAVKLCPHEPRRVDEGLLGRKTMKFSPASYRSHRFQSRAARVLLAQVEVRFLGLRFVLRSPEVNSAGSVLRGRGLEITDDEGRVRASIKLHPASVLPDGTAYPETVLLRLISSQGRPNVKIAATEDGSVVALGGEADPTHVAIGPRERAPP
jgi:hypothetical protein